MLLLGRLTALSSSEFLSRRCPRVHPPDALNSGPASTLTASLPAVPVSKLEHLWGAKITLAPISPASRLVIAWQSRTQLSPVAQPQQMIPTRRAGSMKPCLGHEWHVMTFRPGNWRYENEAPHNDIRKAPE